MTDEMIATRSAMVDYLRRELLGPRNGDREQLQEEPYKRYTVGMLYPRDASADPVTREEQEDPTGAADVAGRGGLQENQADDPVVLANQYLPSSMGLSFYLRGDDPGLEVSVSAARYLVVGQEPEGESGGRRRSRSKRWQRTPVRAPEPGAVLVLAPEPGRNRTDRKILDGAARLNAIWRPGRDGWLVTVTIINAAESHGGTPPAGEDCLYQIELRCRPAGTGHIAAYPRGRALTEDPEEHYLDLLYRHQVAYGVGHGCSVAWDEPIDGATPEIRTDLLPTSAVPAMSYDLPGYDRALELYFLAQGDTETSDDLIGELDRFVAGYREWIEGLSEQHRDIPPDLLDARDTLLKRLHHALGRMSRGVRLLEEDPTVRRAFCLANRAMLMQMLHSTAEYAGDRHVAGALEYRAPRMPPVDTRRWRPFQLAFQLMTIASVAFPDDQEREIVDLIWFPTGGGKTEAYLAVAAFLIFYRRMVHDSAAAGTAVLMRYTLRLLTTQQFQRAATLICACEQLRKETPELGSDEISIGLWVGGTTTPNTYQDASSKYADLLGQDEPQNPFQIDWCPWCGTELVPARRQENSDLYGIHSDHSRFWLFCPSNSCPFHEQLPVQVVDQQLYDSPPALLLATVDKFARLPWEARVAAFFGGEERRPPDLIIQDELHLISGPLGTIVGVYETAIDALASWNGARPKILASTATIRRADDQCLGLYARDVELFPPSGLDASDSYFARYDRKKPGRLYLGVLAPGHTASTSMIRTSAAMLQAPKDLKFQEDELDAYWTLVAYHNSLRELGKSVTFGADDIPARIKVIAEDQDHLRVLSDDNVQELTSNIGAMRLGGMLERMGRRAGEDGELSMLLCTNMLSVGIDVERLGMMLVNGQPKSTSEYIQATSRVGRGERVPGLVVCVYSPSKPRDRSHYERFVAYHSALYRQVEPTSVTPFAQPARDRALHAVLVSLIRHKTGLSEREDAGNFSADLPNLDRITDFIRRRVEHVDQREAASTVAQMERLLREWEERAGDLDRLEYDSPHRSKEVLLRPPGDSRPEGWETLHSMRNVDRSCLISIMGASR